MECLEHVHYAPPGRLGLVARCRCHPFHFSARFLDASGVIIHGLVGGCARPGAVPPCRGVAWRAARAEEEHLSRLVGREALLFDTRKEPRTSGPQALLLVEL